MKKINTLIIALTIAVSSFAQAPQAFKYQAIARDELGNALSLCNISIRISLLQEDIGNKAVYIETYNVQTNIYGLINLVIGEGENVIGDFSNIKWGESRHSLKMEMDIEGGTNFKETGISQLYAVPYALYAELAGNLLKTSGKQDEKSLKKVQKAPENIRVTINGLPNTKFPATGNSYSNVNHGNMGVGTDTPTEKLEVIGNIKASGTISADGPLVMVDHQGNPRELTINPDGTWDIKFLCEGVIKDVRDGRSYLIVKIRNQCWMRENLNIGNMIDGIDLPVDDGTIEKYCFDNLEDNCDEFGGLYNWNEMMQYTLEPQGICPFGWHVPTLNDFDLLDEYLGGSSVSGGAMKETGTAHWNSPNLDATNSSGFTAFGAGERGNVTGSFNWLYKQGYCWSASEDGVTNSFFINLSYFSGETFFMSNDKEFGFSVRCIKNFECGDSLIDYRDRKSYGTVQIGRQCWMSQNLNIGDRINGMDNPVNNGDIEKYCYDDLDTNCDDFGGLYQWGEMMQYVTDESTQGICPDGFHLPSDDEWKVLEGNVDSRFGLGVAEWDKYAARGYDAAFRLKTTFGYISDGYGADTYGFHGFPSGYRSSVGTFSYLGSMAMYWTSSEYITDVGTSRELIYNYFKISRGSYADVFGLGVRCLKDE